MAYFEHYKNQENTNFARIAKPTGERSFVNTQDNGTEPLCDEHGRLIVRIADANGHINSLSSASSYYSSAAYLNRAQVSVTPVRLILASGFNPTATLLYLQFFNLAALPAAAAVPIYSLLVPPTSNFSWMPSKGNRFTVGLAWGVSTTGPTYTDALIANGFWTDIEYS